MSLLGTGYLLDVKIYYNLRSSNSTGTVFSQLLIDFFHQESSQWKDLQNKSNKGQRLNKREFR